MGNWLGLQGLKERFKERTMESKLTDSGGGGRERDDLRKREEKESVDSDSMAE